LNTNPNAKHYPEDIVNLLDSHYFMLILAKLIEL